MDALFECRRLLLQAEKAEVAAASAEKAIDRAAQNKAYLEYAERIAGDNSKQHKVLVYEEFVALNPDLFPFPQPRDLFDIASSNRKLAAVAFMRIWNQGFADGGKVASNRSADIRALRESVLSQALPAPEERSAFEGLLLQLEAARDGLIAHSDGVSASAHHGPGFASVRTSGLALEGVDFNHWRIVTHKLWEVLSSLP